MSYIVCLVVEDAEKWAIRPNFQWGIDAPKPLLPVGVRIFSFRADGNELMLLHRRFFNLTASHTSCTWRGDMAQFIFENL